ncbi:uncharacterized protein PAC_12495 [Phialocephala subalpina]|uniref:DUF5672 domain-containing protein n=1 Tax=Phialocephala subalpina TaxID=576137 RepID=A0A1L7XC51_9HELO|nr:uncharacterized protein PAC_12495 [Phialocephala subalpina]
MSTILALFKSRQLWRITSILVLFFITGAFLFALNPREALADKSNFLLDTSSYDSTIDATASTTENAYGVIKDKVAVISDTQYTSRLIPLILHFHAILGPSWPIIFYTSQETITKHFTPSSSSIWNRAVDDRRIQIRTILPEHNLTSRYGVNLFLSRPWLWEQLAPAKHVLVFQADSIICGNGKMSVDDFMEEGWDWIAATLHPTEHLYNGGLSLRNRSMILDILSEGNNWEEETTSGEWTMGGEDVWFSRKMDERGAKLPSQKEALRFAVQHEWHITEEKEPLGYHKVHKNAPGRLREIERWCPEIALAAPGILEPST